MTIRAALQLWLSGIVLGVITVTFIFWQLDWITPLGGINLLVVSGWLGFAAVVATVNKKTDWAGRLVGIAAVPVLCGFAFVIFFFDDSQLTTALANFMGLMLTVVSYGLMSVWSFAMDFQADLVNRLSKSGRSAACRTISTVR